MKIRIQGHSIRLRLQKKEVQLLFDTGMIQEETQLGSAAQDTWRYALQCAHDVSVLDVVYEPQRLLVQISPELAQELAETDRVGIDHTIERSGVPSLSVLVEKDFKCLTPRAEDADAYPHPETHHCT